LIHGPLHHSGHGVLPRCPLAGPGGATEPSCASLAMSETYVMLPAIAPYRIKVTFSLQGQCRKRVFMTDWLPSFIARYILVDGRARQLIGVWTMAEEVTPRPGRPKDEALIARRQDEILSVAAQVFAQQGFRQTDVQVVADQLGVGKGTIYRYFPTKGDLFLAAVDRGMRQLKECIDAGIAGVSEPLEQMTTALRIYLAFFDEHPEVVELIIHERAEFKDRKKPTYFVYRDAGIGRWRSLFQQLMDAGHVRSMPVDRILDVVGDLMYGTIFTNHFAGRRKPLHEQATEILDIAFNGILVCEQCRQRSGRACAAETSGNQEKKC
jgi:AcrR family transcriptional regulator